MLVLRKRQTGKSSKSAICNIFVTIMRVLVKILKRNGANNVITNN